ncbi:MAG: arginine--tRNA ligase [Bacillota bacterium]
MSGYDYSITCSASLAARIEGLIRDSLTRYVRREDLPGEVADIPFTVEKPKDPTHGELASNVALSMAKPASRPPRQLAQGLAEHLRRAVEDDEYIAAVEVAGPGFINFQTTSTYFADVLIGITRAASSNDLVRVESPRDILVEFVSANPTGPMLVVNARAAALGDVFCRLLNLIGHRASPEYYVNDAGGQIRTLGRSLEARVRQAMGEDVPFPEDGYPGEYLVDLAREYLNEEGTLEASGDDILWEGLGSWAASRILAEQRRLLERYGVRFDRWFHESEIRAGDRPKQVLETLRERGYLYEDDGALWLKSTASGDDKDRVLVKSDGSYTYLLPDLAYHMDKFDRGFDRLINIWGPDHHGYIARMRAGLAALGYPADDFEVVISQWVRLMSGGREVSMSKRGGTYVTMEELLDEVGRDAARFFFLMRSATSPLDFDLDLAKEQSNENPVYYAQYAHARIAGILAGATRRGVPVPSAATIDRPSLAPLGEAEELTLMRRLADFPGEVVAAAEALEPHRLAAYVLEVAALFHSFYTECRVLGEDPEVTRARLHLCRATARVVAEILAMLGVSAPNEM